MLGHAHPPTSQPPQSTHNPLDNYEILEVIGTGSFGKIRKVRRKSDGRFLARKEINYVKMSDKEKMQLVSEVNILRELRHPNIVRYYERHVDKDSGIIYIYMEYCDGGDLGSFLRRCKKEHRIVEEDAIWRVFAQLILALNECHHRTTSNGTNAPPVLHRDLKPENVLLDTNGGVKLGDFGLSRTLEPVQPSSGDPNANGDHRGVLAKTFVGTPYYMSPELLQGQGYNTKSDVWSLGCVIYEMCALQPPFEAANQTMLAARIRTAPLGRIPAHYSEDLNRVISTLLTKDQHKRPSISDLISIPHIQKYILKIRHQQQQRREEEAKKRNGGNVGNGHSHEVAAEVEPVKRREDDYQAREEALRKREDDLKKKEEELRRREEELKKKEEDMRRREEEVVALRSKAFVQGMGTTRKPLHGMPDKENASGTAAGIDRSGPSSGVAVVSNAAPAIERRKIISTVGVDWWGVRA